MFKYDFVNVNKFTTNLVSFTYLTSPNEILFKINSFFFSSTVSMNNFVFINYSYLKSLIIVTLILLFDQTHV